MRKRAAARSRVPHEDPRVEARIRQVEARYAAIARTEQRLADITVEQQANDEKARYYAEHPAIPGTLERQSAVLRAERAELEAFIAQAHKDIAAILDTLGDQALYLGAMS